MKDRATEIVYTFAQWPLAYMGMLAMWMVFDGSSCF